MSGRLLLGSILMVGLAYAVQLNPDSEDVLIIPKLSDEVPMVGKRVKVTASEYAGTEVYHTICLPADWKKGCEKLPIVFEYTGNYFPKTGSTGEVKDAALGYGLGGGKFIWVSLPYIEVGGQENALNWWGDIEATVEYAKVNVPRIIEEHNADPNAVFLCGFSRGSIAVNFIGLHDDEISKLWTAFMVHDHFDGVRQWKAPWGAPLDKYRLESIERLKRVGDRPYLVSQGSKNTATKDFMEQTGVDLSNFTFSYISTAEVFGKFPNKHAKAGHNDVWMSLPSVYRTRTWEWVNGVLEN